MASRAIFTTIGKLKLDRQEDGDCAVIADRLPFKTASSDKDNGMFVIVQSWDDDTEHKDINRLLGRKVKITIEEL